MLAGLLYNGGECGLAAFGLFGQRWGLNVEGNEKGERERERKKEREQCVRQRSAINSFFW